VSKREKKVEVSVKDIERGGQPVQQVFIRGRLIGEVLTNGQRFKAIMLNDGSEFGVRSQEEGLEVVLQQFHLHQY
jgi:endonuclease YncB( thermonuclease family)